MARSLQELQKQYHSSAKPGAPKPGGGGPPGRGPMGMGGKPKNAGKTIARLLSYVGKYKALLFVVFFFMILNTVMSLIGGYMTRPIINRLWAYVGEVGNVESLDTPIYRALDGLIENVKNGATGFIASIVGDGYNDTAASVMFYILATIMILVCIYLFGIITNYMQARVMMTISQNSIEKIRNDLYSLFQRKFYKSIPASHIYHHVIYKSCQ